MQAGEDQYALSTARYAKTRGFLRSRSVTERQSVERVSAQASELGGQTVTMTSGADTRIVGSNVLADQGLSIQAAGQLAIEAAQESVSTSQFREVRRSRGGNGSRCRQHKLPNFRFGRTYLDFNVVAESGEAVHQLALRQVGEVSTHHVGHFGLCVKGRRIFPRMVVQISPPGLVELSS